MEKMVDHLTKELEDKIVLVGELEHMRRHLLRSALSMSIAQSNSLDKEEGDAIATRYWNYTVWADQIKNYRREFMRRELPPIEDEDWCLVKVAASVKQLLNELSLSATLPVASDGGDGSENASLKEEIEKVCDSILSEALDADLSGCSSCRSDKGKEGEG